MSLGFNTKNKEQKRDEEMISTSKNNNYYFGMKIHIGVDGDSGIVYTVVNTTAKKLDIGEISNLLHGKEKAVFGDKVYIKK